MSPAYFVGSPFEAQLIRELRELNSDNRALINYVRELKNAVLQVAHEIRKSAGWANP